jgi:hypothetical protein
LLTVLIPHYNKNIGNIDQVLGECIRSFAGKSSELIVLTDNEKSQYQKLNMGMAMATQPFVMCANNDTQYTSGNLEDMCIEGAVTRPLIRGTRGSPFGHCFCVPKKIWEVLGHFEDRYKHGYYDDDDWLFKLEAARVPVILVDTVDIYHPDHGGTTLENIDNIGDVKEFNAQLFKERWGRTP